MLSKKRTFQFLKFYFIEAIAGNWTKRLLINERLAYLIKALCFNLKSLISSLYDSFYEFYYGYEWYNILFYFSLIFVKSIDKRRICRYFSNLIIYNNTWYGYTLDVFEILGMRSIYGPHATEIYIIYLFEIIVWRFIINQSFQFFCWVTSLVLQQNGFPYISNRVFEPMTIQIEYF